MKKKLLLLVMMMGCLTMHAEDYAYLTFETTDGTKVSVPASELEIEISETTLKAGTQSFNLSNLSRMYFSDSNETTGIASVVNDQLTEITEVYDLCGRKVTKDMMRSGQVYVVKTNNGNYKIAVR